MRHALGVLVVCTLACSGNQSKPADTSRRVDTPSAVATDPVPSTNAIQSGDKAARPTGPTGSTGTSATIIEGRVDEHGADPMTFLAITPRGGAQTRVSGGQLQSLGAVKGAEVWARGRRDGNSFVVDSFEVRRANEQAVEDGVVSVSGTTVTVRTARATLRYPDAPTALRNAAGARVWITAPVAGQAPSFGVIRPARQ